MKCPTCPDATLVMTDRSGVEIDYCPTCRGVWLDRGELDKIIDRVSAAPAAAAPTSKPKYDDGRRYDDDRKYDDRKYPKKKKGILGELFDF